VRRASQRHRIEEAFEEAKGEVGLDHFEVRAWHVGPRDNRQDGDAGELPPGAERGGPPSALASSRLKRTSPSTDTVNWAYPSQ
jgi:hypothetical protein